MNQIIIDNFENVWHIPGGIKGWVHAQGFLHAPERRKNGKSISQHFRLPLSPVQTRWLFWSCLHFWIASLYLAYLSINQSYSSFHRWHRIFHRAIGVSGDMGTCTTVVKAKEIWAIYSYNLLMSSDAVHSLSCVYYLKHKVDCCWAHMILWQDLAYNGQLF